MSLAIAYVTFADETSAHAIGQQLLEQRLIACYNLFPIRSAFWWQGKIENDHEVAALLKTTPTRWSELLTSLRALHPYETPCILRFSVEANAEYAAWIADSVDQGKSAN